MSSLTENFIIMTMLFFELFLLAFAVAVALNAIAIRVFPRLGLLDFPKRYGLARERLPYPLGIIAVLTFLIFFPALAEGTMEARGILIGVLLLAVTTIIDDRTPLPPTVRAGVHAPVALLIFVSGARIYTLTNPLASIAIGGPIIPLDRLTVTVPIFGSLPVWSGIFTVLWLGLTINALNWFDGIPGQVSVLSMIAFLTIGLLAVSARVDQPSLAILAFVLAGIAGASLLFTFPPPRAVLGDTGAMFFGLLIGILTIYSGGKVATAFLVLGVPLIDFVLVIARRILKGKSIVRGDAKDEHLHHRLLLKGWTPRQVIALTAGIGTLFGLSALFLSTFQKFLAALVLFALMLFLSWYSRPKKQHE
ncbi:undecaprenyl/decaprenyl-phosphate alpha-N-acetylglucosaminyl 1-phosphate transferase [Candidatus Peregrinibacteria bacterium]|nr:undecaprenyl/decaprenyl-phosphate alpha-N-acetylglucosaminyl 1-phosphate transferase [Candidatus Peregrinibacteria bacterium]